MTYTHTNPMDSFRLVAETQRQVALVTEQAKQAVKQCYKSPEELAAWIERHGTPVFVMKMGLLGSFLLFILGFEPGFIPASRSKRFQILERLLSFQCPKEQASFRKGVFVLTQPLFTVGFMVHQFHHWLAAQSGLPGYDDQAQSLYRKFWDQQGGVIGQEVETMTVDEIIGLKSAINRDLEALQFIRQIINEILNPAQQSNHLANGNASA